MPGEASPLPTWTDVEAAFLGIPPPRVDRRFVQFANILRAQWPDGVTAAEWATWRHRERRAVQARFDVLVKAQFLTYDTATSRYTLSAAARD